MSCKRFGPAIAAHAGGAPIEPSAERHLSGCAACRRMLDTQVQLLAELDVELARSLSITAPPDFAARVTRAARDAGEAKAQRWIPAPAWAGLGVAAAVVLAVWVGGAFRLKPEATPASQVGMAARPEATPASKVGVAARPEATAASQVGVAGGPEGTAASQVGVAARPEATPAGDMAVAARPGATPKSTAARQLEAQAVREGSTNSRLKPGRMRMHPLPTGCVASGFSRKTACGSPTMPDSSDPPVIVEPSRALAIQRLRELMIEGRLDEKTLPPAVRAEAVLTELSIAPLEIPDIRVRDVEIVGRPPAAIERQ